MDEIEVARKGSCRSRRSEIYFLVDTDKNLLVHCPKDGRLELIVSNRNGIEMTLRRDDETEHTYGIDKSITDANGELLDFKHSGISSGYEEKQTIDIAFEDNGYPNPVRVDLASYPNYIIGDVKIELKKH